MSHSFCRQIRHERDACKDSFVAVNRLPDRALRLQLAAGSLESITPIPPVHTARYSTGANKPGALGAEGQESALHDRRIADRLKALPSCRHVEFC